MLPWRFTYINNMWPIQLHVLTSLVEAVVIPNGRKRLWKNNLEVSFQEIKQMVSAETLRNNTVWKIMFTV